VIFRVLDIETIPDVEAFTPGRPKYNLVPLTSWEGRRYLQVAPAGTEEDHPILPPHAQRVVALACVDIVFDPADSPKYRFDRCWTDCRWGLSEADLDVRERGLLVDFSGVMAGSADVHLVTWNGRTFDLPVIAMRSLKQRVACPWYYSGRDLRYRYSTEGHCDLMDFLSDYGAVRPMKLTDACHLVGLPGKTDMSGDMVEDVYRRSLVKPVAEAEVDMARVAGYCLQDVLQTALLFLRTRHLLGKLTQESCCEALNTVRYAADPRVGELVGNQVDWDRVYP
jgi:predicted PolB exonuclease-like 3'-5' exonuclease